VSGGELEGVNTERRKDTSIRGRDRRDPGEGISGGVARREKTNFKSETLASFRRGWENRWTGCSKGGEGRYATSLEKWGGEWRCGGDRKTGKGKGE